MESAGLADLWVEDWSGVENAGKIRPGRTVNNPNDVFSLWEKLTIIFPRVMARYGIGGIFHANESAHKIMPLYYDGTLGYSLVRGQKR